MARLQLPRADAVRRKGAEYREVLVAVIKTYPDNLMTSTPRRRRVAVAAAWITMCRGCSAQAVRLRALAATGGKPTDSGGRNGGDERSARVMAGPLSRGGRRHTAAGVCPLQTTRR